MPVMQLEQQGSPENCRSVKSLPAALFVFFQLFCFYALLLGRWQGCRKGLRRGWKLPWMISRNR
jgi:hypothetical protein